MGDDSDSEGELFSNADSIRDSLDRRFKLSIKRLVKYEVKPDKLENRVLAFSSNRLFIFAPKCPTRIENKFHYLDLHAIESPKPNKLVLTFGEKAYSFTTLETNTDEVDLMITHLCTSLKTVFPAFSLDRLIKKIDVQPSDRLRMMHDMVNSIEQKETGPCGGFTLMYDCMCEYHELPYRDEVAWDVDTIYLSQDSKELCLRDFDHLNARDLVPIVSALLHNPWFTVLNANNVKLSQEVCTEILHVVQKNSVLESLQLSNTGISNDFLQKLATSILSMSSTQLHQIDISNNPILDDRGIIHLIGSLSSLGKGLTFLDLSKTKLSTKGIRAIAEMMSKNSQVFSSLQTLKMAELASSRGEDLQMLYTFLAQPNMISHLDLSGTDCELERLMAPLQRGCSQNLTYLKLSRTAFTNKRVKEVVVPSSYKLFFSTACSLKTLNLSGCKIPPEALKDLLLGLSSNRNVSNIELNLSSVDLQSQGIQNLQNSLTRLTCITSLNVSNIVFSDQDLSSLLNSIGQNKAIKHLSIGRVFQKVRNMNMIMEELVHVIQDEESVIESLSLADSRLKSNMNQIINALGSNTSLIELDISGNSMGDLGARMLSKALQINNKLKTIMWDRNNTTAQGFEDIADALEKNYTLRRMPVPISDASQAARAQPERTEAALQTIERLLQRNHSPQKYSSDQAYRLQQGFLISSTQQMVDRLVVQSQDTINALSIDPVDNYSKDIETAKALIQDADNSKTLLPKLHDISLTSQYPGNPVEEKIKHIAEELKSVLEIQMKKTMEDMLESTKQQCKAIMGDQVFVSSLQAGCDKNSAFPKDFTTNILASVDNEIFNKLSELNLAVAAHVSDRILDEVIDRLSKSHKTLTNHLNIKKKNEIKSSKTKTDKLNLETAEDVKHRDSPQASPKVQAKRQSMLNRKLRPQSVIDRDRFAVSSPTSSPQNKRPSRTGARSPKSPKTKQKSPKVKSRSKQPVPNIEITYANVKHNAKVKVEEPIYDNAKKPIYMNIGKPGEIYQPEREVTKDSIDEREPQARSVSEKAKKNDDVLTELPTLNFERQKLTHLTADRPKLTNRTNKSRPTTRKSQLPGTSESIDDGLDSFFVSKTDTSVTVETPSSKNDKVEKNKTEPEAKKKLGLFGRNNSKEKEHKAGGLFGKFGKKKDKSPAGRRISEVDEEQSESISDKTESVLQRNSERRSNQSLNSVEKNSALTGSKSDSGSLRSDNSAGSLKSEHSGSSLKSNTFDNVKDSVNEIDKEAVDDKDDKEDKTESGTEEGETEEDELDDEEEVEKVPEKKPLELPKVRKSVEKTSEVKKESENGHVEHEDDSVKKVEEDEKETVKEESNSTEKVSEEQDKKSDDDDDKEEQHTPKLPPGVPKMMGGLVLGGSNMMAELKAKQEKRKSMMPAGAKSPEKSTAEEKKSPFGLVNLKSVGDRKSKENKTETDNNNKDSDTTVRPSSLKGNEPVKPEKPSPTPGSRPISSDSKESISKEKPPRPEEIPTPGSRPTSSDSKESTNKEKPPRAEVPPQKKPIVPMRPKPPPVSSKPKPAPRRSLQSDSEEHADENKDGDKSDDKTKIDEIKETVEPVEKTASKRSVKEEIKSRNSADKSDLSDKGRPLSESSPRTSLSKHDKEEPKRDSKRNSDQKSDDEVKQIDDKKGDSVKEPEAGTIDHHTEDNREMIDSGIVYDSDTSKLSVKDKASIFGSKDDMHARSSSPKSSSLTRNVKPSDMIKDSDTPKRPKSMFAVLQSNPGLKNQKSDMKRETIPKVEEKEEPKQDKKDSKEPESPTDEVVMV